MISDLTMRLVKGDFIVTGPDIAPMKFKSRREADDWCKVYHPASSVTEIGSDGKRGGRKPPERAQRKPARAATCLEPSNSEDSASPAVPRRSTNKGQDCTQNSNPTLSRARYVSRPLPTRGIRTS
jgi:hypothetical protein